ncbi:ABC transporter substrate-binding protein [Aestuariirhabdus sp. Z084]|uniref:ABC transporter substrate-binding protein n=1 Tax=Aestuariirhabdus haliotis TaxID=2918751 RepID=UPI00201B3F82|nr:ABC transporter substrate-binding protein [Aestuariirhabdus haliotis]MCL6417609.1 ABC transporter substrate-binding protein [Aestuariirhabdus haliotis]MCL6421535.1 ABC transporter substrate-binding protein [Aestuariirhabdus haliotis]
MWVSGLLLALLTFTFEAKATIRLVDIAGRTVVLEKPAEKVVLGEGRFMSVLGVLGIKQPTRRVVGMMNDLRLYDPASFERYRQSLPDIDDIPSFGNTNEQSVSVEKIILLNPDVAIFGLSGHGPGKRSRHIIERLEAAGIPIVFIDFRSDPIKNTARSVEIVGEVLGVPEKGKAFSEFYRQELNKVSRVVNDIDPSEYPSVLFELRVSNRQACCLTVSRGMFAEMASVAGGRSIATDLLPGQVGELSLEHAIRSEFDIYVGTAIGSLAESEPGGSVSGKNDKDRHYQNMVLGPGVNQLQARASLQALLSRKGVEDFSAIEKGRAYAIWHHFYNSPMNIYAVQRLAKWFHPERFASLNPEEMLSTMLEGFYPVDLAGSYSVAID